MKSVRSEFSIYLKVYIIYLYSCYWLFTTNAKFYVKRAFGTETNNQISKLFLPLGIEPNGRRLCNKHKKKKLNFSNFRQHKKLTRFLWSLKKKKRKILMYFCFNKAPFSICVFWLEMFSFFPSNSILHLTSICFYLFFFCSS